MVIDFCKVANIQSQSRPCQVNEQLLLVYLKT